MADKHIAPTGNDTTGDGTIGSPYFTPNKCISDVTNPLAAGEHIYALQGTYSYTVAQSLSAIAGASAVNPMWLEVYTTTPGDMIGAAAFDFVGLGSGAGITHVGNYWLPTGIESNNGPSDGWATTSGSDTARWVQCAARGNAGRGWNCYFGNSRLKWVCPVAVNNTGVGIYGSSRGSVLYAPVAENNTAGDIQNVTDVFRGAAQNNTIQKGFAANVFGGLFECVSYNHSNASNGVGFQLTTGAIAVNCISLDDDTAFSCDASAMLLNCGAYGYSTLTVGSPLTIDLLTTDPGFVDAANGDFTVTNDDYIGTGYPTAIDGTTLNLNRGIAQSSADGNGETSYAF